MRTFRHTCQSLYGHTEAGVSPVRERPLKQLLRWRIQSRSCFGLCEMIRGCFAPSISRPMSSTPDHGHQEMLTGFRATYVQTLIGTPICGGNDTSRKVSFYPFCSSDARVFQHFLARPFGAFNLHTGRFDGVEDVCGTFRHTLNPFTGHRKGVSPVRERPLKHC
ncbi:hypothetical protein TNIN_342331 [Trichonephila inaurata madagascariensis]|uniref:Uncharacterized protein n=1 Tax=Trichonephila inaurata madagascariensis TaxID=2747483 RepID=A0A8X6WMN6_9ARAC|nr:hypothetical protein TNIN_342331 [Trichonephila inaurata madagascariensis]